MKNHIRSCLLLSVLIISILIPRIIFSAATKSGELGSPLPLINVDIETGTPYHLLFVGQEMQLGFRFRNLASKAVRFQFDAILTSYHGAELKTSKKLSMEAGSTVVLPLTAPLPERGLWYIDYKLKPDDGMEQADRLSFAWLEPAGQQKGTPNEMLFSVDGGVSAAENIEETKRDIELASLCGVEVCRCTLQFQDAAPVEGQWNEAAFQRFDAAIEFATKHGMSIQFILCYNTRWDNAPQKRDSANLADWLFSVPQPEAWRSYVRKVVSRYHQRVKYWEVWNEADIAQFWTGTSDQYLQILQIAHEEIKEVDPSLQVMTCGFAHFLPHDGPDFIETIAEKGASDFDILAIHQHGPFEEFQYAVDVPLHDLRAKLHPPKLIYFNETAISRENGDHLPVETLWQKAVYAWSQGAMGYTWYNLRDGYLNLEKRGHPWGMFTRDYYPTPTYVAYNTLVTYLRNKKYGGTLELGNGFQAFRFADAKGMAIVSWSRGDVIQALPSVLRVSGVTRAFWVDPMGNRKDVPVEEGRVLLCTEATPRLLILEGNNPGVQSVEPLITIHSPPFADPGREITLQISLRNPFRKRKAFTIHTSFPRISVEQDENYIIEAASSHQFQLVIPPNLKHEIPGQDSLGGFISYAVSDTSWHGDLPIFIRFGTQIAPGSPSIRPPDFDLCEKKNLVNLYENIPQNENLLWKGPEDLSAKIWLSRDADSLQIHAEVRDDHACPSPTSERLWDGDCVEFALRIGNQAGYWKFAAGLHMGKTELQCWAHPKGTTGSASLFTAEGSYDQGRYVYDFMIPRASLGCDEGWPDRMTFNFMANDSDNGHYRKQWMEIAPGLGRNTFNPGVFTPLFFETNKPR